MELTPRELALMHRVLAQPGHAVTKERAVRTEVPRPTDVRTKPSGWWCTGCAKTGGHRLTLMTLRGLGTCYAPMRDAHSKP